MNGDEMFDWISGRKKIICDVLVTKYCAPLKEIKITIFGYAKILVTATLHRGALEETIKQDFKCLSWSDTSMQVLVWKQIRNLGFTTLNAIFVRQRVTNVVMEKLSQKEKAAKKISFVRQ